uniref:Nuclear pore complex protein n=1 Tax=Macrostomum lignano TaxID=282301 RepID=A0A1I8GHJ8_9PLAT
MFDDAESNPALSDLLIEFLSINEVAETAKAFESCECLSSSSLKLVKDCSSQVLFNKQLAELKTQEWKPLCEITAKAKRLQFESLALWHAEGVPVVRAAVIDSIGSEIENENSAANRRALSDLLSLSGLFDEQFALKFMSIVFSSDCQWLIKLCLDSFDSALLSHIEASDSDELPAVLAQFIRLSCNYYCKSTSLCEIFGLSLEHLLSVQPSQQRPTSALELLPLLLERNFMWMWMTSDSDPSIQPLAEAVRLKLSSKLQCIADFA